MKTLLVLLAHLALVLGHGHTCPQTGVRYYPDSKQCDKYFECRNGLRFERLCPDGLLFNDKITDGRYPCFYPPEVDCGSRYLTQPPQPSPNCPRQWGYFGSQDRSQCGYYYNCVGGVGHRIECPYGLAFSSATYVCEWPGDSPDCDAEEYLGFYCPPGASSGQKFPSTKSCRDFFVCVGGSPRVLTCGLGLVFDAIKSKCVNPAHVPACANYYTPQKLDLYSRRQETASHSAGSLHDQLTGHLKQHGYF